MRLAKAKETRINSKKYKDMVQGASSMLDNMIQQHIEDHIEQQEKVSGYILGFVNYLETRDKKAILCENLRKAKATLRKNRDSVFAIT
jgi:hypothetical protein